MTKPQIKMAMVPVGMNCAFSAAISLARILADEVNLIGIISIGEGESVSAGAQSARQIRKKIKELNGGSYKYKSSVIVSEKPWPDLKEMITREKPDYLIIDWVEGEKICGIPLQELLTQVNCDSIIVRGEVDFDHGRTLIAIRGGPHAEMALKMGLLIKPNVLDVLHLSFPNTTNDAPFKGLRHILRQMPDINLRTQETDDFARTLYDEARKYDLVILGATASKNPSALPISSVAEKLLRESPSNTMVVKTHRSISQMEFDESAGVKAISILVDRWFAQNTYHADEFSDLSYLMELKNKQGSTISLALPSLNEEGTVGKIISSVKNALMDDVPLLDEIILMDSNSTDKTREIAEDLGIPVYIHQNLLPELGARAGKGEALWKSVLVTKGDIIAWIDTDIINIHPRFVYGIIGPLLLNRELQLVKGYYRRPLRVGEKIQAGGGGRVTELTARPLINLFYPELSGVIQPLSGEYAGRREALEKAIFFSGYGVETGLLIDVFENFGLRTLAQVDLLERIHKNQELVALSKMSFAIIQTILRKLEMRFERAFIEDVNKSMKLIQSNRGGYFLEVEEIAELERPPMIDIPEYIRKHKK